MVVKPKRAGRMCGVAVQDSYQPRGAFGIPVESRARSHLHGGQTCPPEIALAADGHVDQLTALPW